jgi:putative transposase
VEGTSKTATISKGVDGWHVCCSCADVPTGPLPLTERETSIDVGLNVYLITANGDAVEYPRHHRTAQRGLKKAQQRVSRRMKRSHRRKQAAQQCAKQYQHVRRQRQAFHYKTALALVRQYRQYDVVYVEAIQVANLTSRPAPVSDGHRGYPPNGASRTAGLNKSIRDAGWARFPHILACKAAWAGKRVEAVNPAYRSQDRSGCGTRIQKGLRVRTHRCTHCGQILDRDANAARNIQWRGQRLRG